jgi:hypothetical protein
MDLSDGIEAVVTGMKINAVVDSDRPGMRVTIEHSVSADTGRTFGKVYLPRVDFFALEGSTGERQPLPDPSSVGLR